MLSGCPPHWPVATIMCVLRTVIVGREPRGPTHAVVMVHLAGADGRFHAMPQREQLRQPFIMPGSFFLWPTSTPHPSTPTPPLTAWS